MTSTLSERIKQARKHAGITQKELAMRVGISQTAIHKLEGGGSHSSRKTVAIALTCGVDPIWLDTGLGEMALPGASSYLEETYSDVNEKGERKNTARLIARVPLISWEALVKHGDEPVESFAPEVSAWVPVAPKGSDRCFALKVPDDSMEPDFGEGEVIVIDPLQKGGHNKFLVASESGNRPTFKQLVMHGEQTYLKPLNSRYPLIQVKNDLRVIGVLVCKYKDYQ
ncbi:MAG: helix-turn-helix domain-containing protein [Magnetococcales bacterium]|nr:helix-turn-helix domain-containing protein [Magnetococcales bacterium]